MSWITNKLIYITLLLSSANALSHPTSKEYVDMQIKETVRALQEKMNQQNVTIDSRIKQLNQTVEVQLFQIQHQIGESYQGGIIFWVDKSKQHGLVVAKMDAVPEGLQWLNGDSGYKTTNAQSSGLFVGLLNTYLIVSEQTIDDQNGQFAALAAKNFAVQEDGITSCSDEHHCYGNWYLPSVYELNLLKKSLKPLGLGAFHDDVYWSSTERDTTQAWILDFITGNADVCDKSTVARIRAIHGF